MGNTLKLVDEFSKARAPGSLLYRELLRKAVRTPKKDRKLTPERKRCCQKGQSQVVPAAEASTGTLQDLPAEIYKQTADDIVTLHRGADFLK